MMRPRYVRREEPIRYCENPQCGAKLPSKVYSNKKFAEQKYCDRKCSQEHQRILMLERRPKDLKCAACGKDIDVLSREAARLNRQEYHFCDGICADKYHRLSGHYQRAALKGVESQREYKEKHGKMHNYEERAKKISENNQEAPPKAKYFVRTGYIWGYPVRALPDEDSNGYRLMITEHPYLGIVRAKTFKECLKLMRQRIIDSRTGDVVPPGDEGSPLPALSDNEFTEFYNAFMARRPYYLLDGYQRIAGHYADTDVLSHALDVELVRRYAAEESEQQ